MSESEPTQTEEVLILDARLRRIEGQLDAIALSLGHLANALDRLIIMQALQHSNAEIREYAEEGFPFVWGGYLQLLQCAREQQQSLATNSSQGEGSDARG